MSIQDFQEVMYQVVVNDEAQYALWPANKAMALGWVAAGQQGSKAECLDYIQKVWTDMRPLSLQKQMAPATLN